VMGKAILGVDLGSLFMKVALVQRGAPLEIVTNTHSKRKTETMILFDANTRFYGADASSLVARKPLQTPMLMNIMLGRDAQHPCVMVRIKRDSCCSIIFIHLNQLKYSHSNSINLLFFIAIAMACRPSQNVISRFDHKTMKLGQDLLSRSTSRISHRKNSSPWSSVTQKT
jgi:hypothetical protein